MLPAWRESNPLYGAPYFPPSASTKESNALLAVGHWCRQSRDVLPLDGGDRNSASVAPSRESAVAKKGPYATTDASRSVADAKSSMKS